MTTFWQRWLTVWCGLVVIFGGVLCGAGLHATSGSTVVLFHLLNPSATIMMEPALRFSTALMGAVTLGWGLTIYIAVQAATLLGTRAAPIWRLLIASLVIWYIIDSTLSVATGFGLNAVSNTVFLLTFLLPVWRSGVLVSKPA